MSADRLFVDAAATTPLHADARAAMVEWVDCGNPSSLYLEGRRAKEAIDTARETLSLALGSLFAENVFTSSGTEAANLALVGAALAHPGPRRRILMSAVEHHAVLHTRQMLERLGFRVEIVPVDEQGLIRLDALASMLGDDVLLLSVMHANNEIGTVQPIANVTEAARRHGVLLHVDAVQTFLRDPDDSGGWTAATLGADLISISAHKVHGPKGIGALWIRAGTPVAPVAVGGGQEREMRAGTENVAAIAGFGAAIRARLGSVPDRERLRRDARDAFLAELAGSGRPWVATLAAGTPRLCGHAHLRFPGLSAESLLIVLDRMGVCASSGAACSSGSLEPSHVLLACGWAESEASEGLRFTFDDAMGVDRAREAARRVMAAAEQVGR